MVRTWEGQEAPLEGRTSAEPCSPTFAALHPLSHKSTTCCARMLPFPSLLRSLPQLLPTVRSSSSSTSPSSSVCEERGPDTACPFNTLPTFDTPSTEVSLTYFPPRRSFMLSTSAGGGRWGAKGRRCRGGGHSEGGAPYAPTAVPVR